MYKFTASTLWLGKKVINLPRCPSTNSFLLDLSTKEKIIEGTAVITAHQTSGRGQRDTTWESEPYKNLMLSLALYPSFLLPTRQFDLSIAISNSVYETLANHLAAEKLKIKWPNDIYFEDKKLVGILIENQLRGNSISLSVVGIGVNVNQKQFMTPNAVSMTQILTHEIDIELLLDSLLVALEKNYTALKTGKTEGQRQFYLTHLYRYQEWHFYQDLRSNSPTFNATFEGQIVGVNPTGQLILLQKEEYSIDYFRMKEIKFL